LSTFVAAAYLSNTHTFHSDFQKHISSSDGVQQASKREFAGNDWSGRLSILLFQLI